MIETPSITTEEADLLLRSKKKMKEGASSDDMQCVEVNSPPARPTTLRLSFADMVKKTGSENSKGISFKGAVLLDQNKISISPPSTNSPYPIITINLEYRCSLETPWKKTITVKLLGRTLPFPTIQSRLVSLWKPGGDFSLIELGNGFYLFKYDDKDTIDRALTDGPWMIFGSYVAVQK